MYTETASVPLVENCRGSEGQGGEQGQDTLGGSYSWGLGQVFIKIRWYDHMTQLTQASKINFINVVYLTQYIQNTTIFHMLSI